MVDVTAGYELLKRRWEGLKDIATDQKKKIPLPALEKPYAGDVRLVDLVAPQDLTVGQMPLIDAITRRKSHRTFTDAPLSLEELSFLLWATQGVKEVFGDGYGTRRTVPSAGARHSFETYLCIERVEGVPPGLYRYLALEHKLCLVRTGPDLYAQVNQATRNQNYGGAIIFVWATIPYRMEWRYSYLAPKLIALDAGHVCQNLYLACQSIACGNCALDAYDQDKMDALLGVDGKSEFAVYCSTVGKIAQP